MCESVCWFVFLFFGVLSLTLILILYHSVLIKILRSIYGAADIFFFVR